MGISCNHTLRKEGQRKKTIASPCFALFGLVKELQRLGYHCHRVQEQIDQRGLLVGI